MDSPVRLRFLPTTRRAALFRLIRLVAYVGIADLAIGLIVQPHYTQTFFDRVRSYQREVQGPDVVLLGSSRSVYGFDDHLARAILTEAGLNRRVVNLSGLGGSGSVNRMVFDSFIAPRMDAGQGGPQLILIDVNRSEIKKNFQSPNAVRLIDDTRERLNRLNAGLLRNLATFGRTGLDEIYRDLLRDEMVRLLRFSAMVRLLDDIEARGWFSHGPKMILSKLGLQAHSKKLRPEILEFGEYEVGGPQTDDLERLIQEAKQRGIKVVLLSFPQPQFQMEAYPSGVVARYDAFMRDLAARNGVEFKSITQSASGVLDDEFFDHIHLGRAGQEKLTASVVRDVILPEIRG